TNGRLNRGRRRTSSSFSRRRIYLSSSDRAAADSLASFHALLPGLEPAGLTAQTTDSAAVPRHLSRTALAREHSTIRTPSETRKPSHHRPSPWAIRGPRALPMQVLKRILELTKLRARLGRMHVVAGLRAMGPIGTVIVVL